ncbi:MAG: choice-of-anchor Q domain-containing protein, partial [Isosphaeraceae bacterium]
LTNCTVSDNTADKGAGGIGLYYTTATLTNCTVSDNTACSGGGGVAADSGTITLTNCTVSGNSSSGGAGGGGLYNSGSATLINCTVSGNSSSGNGGGLTIATATLTDCTVSDNTASGYGGGIIGGTTTLTNCTVSGNSAGDSGGGISTGGAVTLTDCTVSHNSTDKAGGGINAFEATTILTNCTVGGNSAASDGGGLVSFGGTTTLTNTIVALNMAITGPDVSGGVASQGNNLIGETDGSSGWISSDLTGTIALPLDPLLAPLGDYGGPTETMALLPGSAAIGAGTAESGISTDQRGASRPTSGAADIGAFESSGFTLAVTSGSGQSNGITTAFSAPLVVTVTANNPSEPVAGGLVTFTPPPNAASATLNGSPATISATGTASVTATANATTGTYVVTASATGVTSAASFSLTNELQPSFSGLTAQTITYGSTVTLSGTLAAGSQVPVGEDVAVTLDGVTNDAKIASNGSFSTQFTGAEVVLKASSTAYTVTYDYATDGTFLAADGSSQLKVNPAELTIRAVSTSMVTGQPVPTLKAVYTGFVDGDTPASLTTTPVLDSVARPSSAPGSYPITVGGASSPNYVITYVPGTLTVVPLPATVEKVSVQEIKVSKHKTLPGIVLQFSEALDPATAQSINSYTLVTVPNNKKQTSKPVPLSAAIYSSSAFTVTLFTRNALVLNPPLLLTVKAASLRDALGRELDGNDSGRSGANFTAVLSKAGTSVTSARALARIGGLSSHAVDAVLEAGLQGGPLNEVRKAQPRRDSLPVATWREV